MTRSLVWLYYNHSCVFTPNISYTKQNNTLFIVCPLLGDYNHVFRLTWFYGASGFHRDGFLCCLAPA